MIEIAGLTILVLLGWGALMLGLLLLKAVLWLVLFPLRLAFYALVLPLVFILKGVLGGVFVLLLAPILAIVALTAFVALAAAVLVPVLPLVLVAFVIWFIARWTRGEPALTRV